MGFPQKPKERSPSAEQRRSHVERLLGSAAFSNAPGLKRFLQFIVSETEEGRADAISEYSIATEVFGRPPEFDPTSDTIVRTQAYRLRLKLREYYKREGKAEELAIEIPKGHYVPVFSARAGNGSEEPEPLDEPEPPAAGARPRRSMRIAAAVLVAVVVFIGGAAAGARWFTQARAPAAQGIESQFWSSFLNPDRHLVVSFWDFTYLVSKGGALLPARGSVMVERAVPADPEFAADPKLAAAAGPLYYENGFAALGDMLGVERLSLLVAKLGGTATAVRAHQLTVDELRNNDVVFLGHFEDRGNLAWQPEHWPWRFAFRSGPGLWNTHIVDTAARAGSASRFALGLDPGSHAIRTDYALISVVPGVSPNRRVVVLGGLTTSGTQGAAEFLTSEAGLRELLAGVGVRENNRRVFPRFFQCVVRVEVARGLDVIKTSYVTGAAFEPKL